jgi:hypothetical protein
MNERSFIVKSHFARVEVVSGSAQSCLSKVERAANPSAGRIRRGKPAVAGSLSTRSPSKFRIQTPFRSVVRHDMRGLHPQCQAINRKAA